MPILTGDFGDLIAGAAVNATVTAYVETNVEGSPGLVDTTNNMIRLGKRYPLSTTDGAFSVDLPSTDATDLGLPAGQLQYQVVATFTDPGSKGKDVWRSGWFFHTAAGDLSDKATSPTTTPPAATTDSTVAPLVAAGSTSTTMANLKETFAPLLAGSFGRGDRTLSFAGDSNTAQGVSAPTFGNTTSEIAEFTNNGWVGHATLRSDAHWRFRSVRATASYTPTQIRTDHIPGIITDNPWACAVLAGTNSEPTTAESITALAGIYADLEDAGIHPICCTIPPRGSSTYEADLNTFIRRYARDNGHVLVDFHRTLADPATGTMLAAYDSGDGVHPNAAGSAVMADTFTAALSTVLAGRNYDPASDVNADTALLIPNAVFTGAINADTAPNGWVVQTALGTSTITTDTDADVRGKKMVLTRGDSDVNIRTNHVTMVAGHRYLLSFRVKVAGVGSSPSFRLEETTVGSQKLAAWTTLANPHTGWSTVFHEFTWPASGPTSNSWRFKINVPGAGGVLEIAEFTWMDLTARGLV